jgi:aminoglycoside/choline kinase family phosphotransferase
MGARGAQIEGFLAAQGWGRALRAPFSGDASFRSYARLIDGQRRAIVMDAPPPHEDVRPFIAVARILAGYGYSAPQVLAADAEAGLAVLEDLGDDLYTRVLAADGDEAGLYGAAVDLLADLHRRPPPPSLPRYDMRLLVEEANLFTRWYLPALHGVPTSAPAMAEFDAHWRAALKPVCAGRTVVVLRDYHADNLMWLPRRRGLRRVGLLDFQDAVIGAAAYDLVSLLEDARRDVPADVIATMIARYLDLADTDVPAFRAAYATLGAQRNTKIIGIFTRLCARDGKSAYLDLIPRVWRWLGRDLEHPALAQLRAWYDRHVPAAARRGSLHPSAIPARAS